MTLERSESLLGAVVLVVNIATVQNTEDLIKARVNAVKVESGFICITRVITGFNVPRLTTVMDCTKVTKDHGVLISFIV